ncbi:MAG: type II toxin-antitoxin system VapC family toxin [Parvularculaceae bacterium]|nr:type II toxin-antitoxin system VapC family toxin [Parvularculaceae bacterium]
MNLLFDTHLLLWAAADSVRLPDAARQFILEETSIINFSAASIWEVAIKCALGREDFAANPKSLRAALIDAGWNEIAITGEHAAGMLDLAPIHKDPFDRMLLSQARVEGMTLLTSDAILASYPGDVRKV